MLSSFLPIFQLNSPGFYIKRPHNFIIVEYLTIYITEILILLFIVITFLQSGLDKITDWQGNISWLKGHFSKTFLAGQVSLMTGIILIIEVLTGLLAIAGIIQILISGTTTLSLY